MSGIAVVYDYSNTPVDPGVLERVMDRLSHRGPDGRDAFVSGHAALGHWHFWTVPEDVGERQPLQLSGMPFRIVFDGRLDNRPELFAHLGLDPEQGKHISDAALVLHAYARWGEHCFERFVGEFGLAILDEQKDRLVCARDQLGDRTLFYALRGARLVAASEPWAVAGADGLKPEINERAVAHYFALKATEDGQTLFEGVFELLPAHVMIVNASGERKWRYWQPDPAKKIRYKTDEEYAEHFRALLEESVRCRMRATTPVGVLMSGGLDSTSVASLAARMIAPQQLTTISYVFDELADCDERVYINSVKEKYNLRSIQIPCDDAWPLKDWEDWPRNPNQPEGNPYRLLKERAYRRANQEGLRVLLTGAFGDELYSGEADWLSALLEEKRFREAGRELKRHFRYAGLGRTLEAGYVRRIARRLVNKIPGGRRFRRKGQAPAWLTSRAAGYLSGAAPDLDPAFELKRNILGREAANSCTEEIFNASRHALDLRHPYRDRRLVEFVLALPAHQLYNRGYYKYILRVALRSILPENIRVRQQPTPLLSLFRRGIEREKHILQARFKDHGAVWCHFVSADWLDDHWNIPVTPETDGPDALVPWLCVSFAAWHQAITSLFMESRCPPIESKHLEPKRLLEMERPDAVNRTANPGLSYWETCAR